MGTGGVSGVRRHWRSSYRRQIIVGVVLIVAASVVGQFLVSTAINARVKSAERRTLQEQAQIFADEVARVGDLEKRDTAKSVARLLPDTRIVVTWPVGDGGLWYNLTQISRQDAEVTATSGEVEVRLARQYNQTSASSWVIVAVIALVGVIATVVYLLAESVARRLRQQVKGLADTASSFSSGDWSARAVESNDELGRAAAAFNHMADRLAEADASQRRFLADVAHELRTPVTAIDGFAAALGDGTAASDEDRAEALGFIRDEAARLRILVSDLRDLTRWDLDEGADAEVGDVDLADRAETAVARFAAGAHDAGVTLEARGGRVIVRSDARHVDTILSNLVSNALAATPRGGTVRVAVSAADDGGGALSVRDTGRGIAAEDRARIFDRLYRVDTARSRDDGGSGLGLAIVKRLVDRLGGVIDVESTLGQGSVFTVTLPSESPADPPAAGPSTRPTPTEE